LGGISTLLLLLLLLLLWGRCVWLLLLLLDIGFCHLICSISSDVIGWTRSIRFINPKGHSAFIQTCDWLYIAVFLISFHYST
jgi:hypothetical protein